MSETPPPFKFWHHFPRTPGFGIMYSLYSLKLCLLSQIWSLSKVYICNRLNCHQNLALAVNGKSCRVRIPESVHSQPTDAKIDDRGLGGPANAALAAAMATPTAAAAGGRSSGQTAPVRVDAGATPVWVPPGVSGRASGDADECDIRHAPPSRHHSPHVPNHCRRQGVTPFQCAVQPHWMPSNHVEVNPASSKC